MSQAASGKRPRKEESGKRGDETSGQRKDPQGVPVGRGDELWITYRSRQGRLELRAK